MQPTDPAFVESCGVRLLTNEAVTVDHGGATVAIAGIDDTDGGHDDLPAVLAALDRRPGGLRLLLSHHAEVIRRTAPGDFHLTLAGDTHGGQICLPLPGRRVLLSDLGARVRRGRLRRRRPPALRDARRRHQHAAVPGVLPAGGGRVPRGGRPMTPAAPGAARRGRRARRSAAGLLVLLLVLLIAAIALPACGGNADPFAGLYWEPSTGRRVEIRKEEDGYLLYYGAAKRPFKATRDGDELRIADPMGGQTVVPPRRRREHARAGDRGQDHAAQAAAAAPVARRRRKSSHRSVAA